MTKALVLYAHPVPERAGKTRYLALYDMNHATPARTCGFLTRVGREMERF